MDIFIYEKVSVVPAFRLRHARLLWKSGRGGSQNSQTVFLGNIFVLPGYISKSMFVTLGWRLKVFGKWKEVHVLKVWVSLLKKFTINEFC
jgi:hypothetical protein